MTRALVIGLEMVQKGSTIELGDQHIGKVKMQCDLEIKENTLE